MPKTTDENIRTKSIQWFREILGLAKINANQGKINCVHCALRLDDYIREGSAGESIIPVPKKNAGLELITTFPLDKPTEIIRFESDDARILDRCTTPLTNTTTVIYNFTDDHMSGPVLDLTLDDETTTVKQRVQLTRVKTDENNLNERLILLPRRNSDGASFGLIVLNNRSTTKLAHVMNFYVDIENEVYFIDAQNNTIVDAIDFTQYCSDVFFIQSMPKEGFYIKLDEIEVKHEVIEPEIDIERPKRLRFRNLLAKGELLDDIQWDQNHIKLKLKAKYDEAKFYPSINSMLLFMYRSVEEFQEKFIQPQKNDNLLYLTLRNNHGYKNVKQIIQALIAFAAPQKHYIRGALAQGNLLEGVERKGNLVKLKLNERYNRSHYLAINRAIGKLYLISNAFQEKFDAPTTHAAAPYLVLKENHGFQNEQEIQNALISFAQDKEYSNLKDAWIQDELIERVELNENQVTLIFKETYQASHYHIVINDCIHNIYKMSEAFQKYFEKPKRGIHSPCLTLKKDHHYQDEKEILEDLKCFAAHKTMKIKKALNEGKLLQRVEREGNRVKLILQKAFNHSHHIAVNEALAKLYRDKKEFRGKFKEPIKGTLEPCLILLENHGFQSNEELMQALINFAAPKKLLHVKDALNQGNLLKEVQLRGNRVTIILKDEYDEYYKFALSKVFVALYSTTKAFRDKFEQPKRLHDSSSALILILKRDHGYQNEQEILKAIVSFAAPKERLKVKEALCQAELLAGIEWNGHNVKLLLKTPYDENDYLAINEMLFKLYTCSPEFKNNFEKPKKSKFAPCLTLKKEHAFTNEQEILDTLISFAKPQKIFNVKQTLADGDLIERVERDGYRVNLVLKPQFNEHQYFSICIALYRLYASHSDFKKNFETPTRAADTSPYLILKKEHEYHTNDEILKALIGFAKTIKKLNFKQALANRELVDHVELNGNQVKLFLKEPYSPDEYYAISRMLFTLYKDSDNFAKKFERPKMSYSITCLILKNNHGYPNEDEILKDLISFAEFRLKRLSKSMKAEFTPLFEQKIEQAKSIKNELKTVSLPNESKILTFGF